MAAHENLSKGQFRVLNTYGGTGTQIDYVRPNPSPLAGIGDTSTHVTELTMNISHTPDRTTYDYADTDPNERTANSIHVGPSSAHASYARNQARRDRLSPDDANQPTLFGMHTEPGHSTVSYLVGTKAGRIHAPAMLGIAQNRTIADLGRSLEASEDLSPHSHRMVNKLAAAGAIAPAEDWPSNDMTFRREPYPYKPGSGVVTDRSEAVPESEVRRGRRTVRRVLKGGDPDPRGRIPDAWDKAAARNIQRHPPKRKPDPNQGTLF